MRLDRQVQLGGGVLQRVVGGVMRGKIRVEVTENSNTDGIAHRSYCNGEGFTGGQGKGELVGTRCEWQVGRAALGRLGKGSILKTAMSKSGSDSAH